MAYNPWTSEMLANDYHLGSKREAAIIARENGNDDPYECGKCGKLKGHYKGTVGAVVCYACGSVRCFRPAAVGQVVRIPVVPGEMVEAKVAGYTPNRQQFFVEGSEDLWQTGYGMQVVWS